MTEMRTYSVTIQGLTPLLLHHDDIDWADHMTAWKDNPQNKRVSKAGDDRTPAWRWIGCLYRDDEYVGVAAENIARCFMEGGAMVPVPGGKSGKTFKAQSQSGMKIDQMLIPLDIHGNGHGSLEWSAIEPLLEVDDWREHPEAVKKLGFRLLTKRARVGASKHIRVRPRFDKWWLRFTISVWDEQLTEAAIRDIIHYAGTYKGLGDWRPGGKTPGSYGMFELVDLSGAR